MFESLSEHLHVVYEFFCKCWILFSRKLKLSKSMTDIYK